VTDLLAFAITVGCAGGGCAVLLMVALRRYLWRRVVPMLLVLQVSLLVQAVLDVVGLVRGHRPAEPATHLGYLVTSLVVLPAATGSSRNDDDRWAGVLVAVALLALTVIVVRMMTTWRGT
jgi:hypothetical protein